MTRSSPAALGSVQEASGARSALRLFLPAVGWPLLLAVVAVSFGKNPGGLAMAGLFLGFTHGTLLVLKDKRRFDRAWRRLLDQAASELDGLKVARVPMEGWGLVGVLDGVPVRLVRGYGRRSKRRDLRVVVQEELLGVTVTAGDGGGGGDTLPGFDGFLVGRGDTATLTARLDADGRDLLYRAIVERGWFLTDGFLTANTEPVVWDQYEIAELVHDAVKLARCLRGEGKEETQ